jgi:hypothetical protein
MADDTTRTEIEWDAQIEADYQRAVAATKVVARRRRRARLLGAPYDFLVEVCRRTEGRAPFLVALLLYRRTCVLASRKVTLPGAELDLFDTSRSAKQRALLQLEAGGLIQIDRSGDGRAPTVTLLWPDARLPRPLQTTEDHTRSGDDPL